MSTRLDADDIAETEFCLDPSGVGDERMVEEGEDVNEEWLKMKKNVEDGEDDKIRERSVNL